MLISLIISHTRFSISYPVICIHFSFSYHFLLFIPLYRFYFAFFFLPVSLSVIQITFSLTKFQSSRLSFIHLNYPFSYTFSRILPTLFSFSVYPLFSLISFRPLIPYPTHSPSPCFFTTHSTSVVDPQKGRGWIKGK